MVRCCVCGVVEKNVLTNCSIKQLINVRLYLVCAVLQQL